MIELDALVRAHAGTFALETVRVAGVVIAAPLAWQSAPIRVRGALVLLVAFAAHAEGAVVFAEHSIEQMAFSVGSEYGAALAASEAAAVRPFRFSWPTFYPGTRWEPRLCGPCWSGC